MGKYSQKQHCFYLQNIKLHQGCTDHEYWRKMLMTWHFILPNLLNTVCGSFTEVKSCQRKELLYARFLCKNRFPNTVPYFALWYYIKKTFQCCAQLKSKGKQSQDLWTWRSESWPCFLFTHVLALTWRSASFQLPAQRNPCPISREKGLKRLEEGGFKGAQFLEHGFIP